MWRGRWSTVGVREAAAWEARACLCMFGSECFFFVCVGAAAAPSMPPPPPMLVTVTDAVMARSTPHYKALMLWKLNWNDEHKMDVFPSAPSPPWKHRGEPPAMEHFGANMPTTEHKA